MKAIAVLLVLALAVFANAEEAVMGQELAAVEQVDAEAVAMAMEVDESADEDEMVAEDEEEVEDEAEAEDEAQEEDEAVEESEDEAEAEDESEDEFSLLEAEAEAETEEERKSPVKKAKKALKKVKVIGKKKGSKKRVKTVRAPRALKNKPFKFHSERIVANVNGKPEDPEMEKLNLALAAVKEDILSTNKQITDERKWVIAVAKIIASYNGKMKRVEAHIIALRKEMKSLYRKKKQIENLKLQRALEAKLKEARDELATLTGSLKHVQYKSGELRKSGSDLRVTIAGIQAQLAKLRGQQIRKPRAAARGKRCGKGKRYSRKAKKCVARKARKAGRKAAKKF